MHLKQADKTKHLFLRVQKVAEFLPLLESQSQSASSGRGRRKNHQRETKFAARACSLSHTHNKSRLFKVAICVYI